MGEVEKPLVTIITVTYNSEKYIRDAIDSILYQSYDNFECIVSDDCSSDATWQIVQEYEDKRIRKFRNNTNIGEYNNRNTAVARALGRYIFFVDGDDVVLYRGISDAVRELERYPDCSMAIVKSENPKFIGPLRIQRGDVLNLEYKGGGILDSSLANNAFRTDFLQKNPFLAGYKNGDKYSRISYLAHTDVLVLISPISVWRQSEAQVSKSLSRAQIYWEHLHFIKHHLISNQWANECLSTLELKALYYKMLGRAVMHRIRFFDLAGVLKLKIFLIDNLAEVARFFWYKRPPEYWENFNYENLNMEFRHHRK
jgi:glycosyltransferase involved in cell wall biosynthesis